MVRISKAITVSVFSLSLLATTACGDDKALDVVGNSSPGEYNNGTNNGPQPGGNNSIPANSKLQHTAPCSASDDTCVVSLTFSSRQDIAVKLVDGNGAPIANTAVRFEMVQPVEAQGTVLGAANAITGNDGIAKTTVTAGTTPGTAEIKVSTGNESVSPISFYVGVNSKDASVYHVNVIHAGTAQFNQLDVLLYKPDVSCGDLADDLARERDDDPNTHPRLTAEYTRRGLANADGSIPPVTFPDLRNGEAFTVAAKSYALNNDNVEVTYGCQDNNPAIENGMPVTVDVEIIDHVPYIQGTYSTVNTFDLREGLPPTVRQVVDIIGRIATDQGSFVVGCPAGEPGCSAGGDEGLIHLLLGILPPGSDVRNSIETILGNQFVHATVRDAINALFDSWLEDNAPAWVNNTLTITEDIYDTLKEFRTEGKIFINEAPIPWINDNQEVVGRIPDNSARQLWNTLIFYWDRGCDADAPPSCRVHRLTAHSIGTTTAPIEGYFNGEVIGAGQLRIAPHTLSLNYGALLMAVIEKIALPAIFGPHVDSIDELLRLVVNCDNVANAVSSQGQSMYNVVKNLCEELIETSSSSLRDYVSESLVATGHESFQLGTPANDHCTIYQPENYVGGTWPGKPLPYIQELGKSEPTSMECKWDVRVRFSETFTAQMNGRFHGERDSF